MKKIGIGLVVLIFPVSSFTKFSSSSSSSSSSNIIIIIIINVIIVCLVPTVSEPWWEITSVIWLY
jgi:hypothetical protein